MDVEVSRRLQAMHLHLKEDWLRAAVGYCEANSPQITIENLVSMVCEQFVYSDLTESYLPPMTLPGAALKLCIVKPLVFQLIGCLDISSSIHQQHMDRTRTDDNLNWFHGDEIDETASDESDHHPNKKRVLKLKLCNGKQTFNAMEFGVLSLSNDEIIPGAKLLLTGRALCRRGVLLLNDSNCQFLGGEVSSLFHSFEGLSKRAKDLGINTDKKCCSTKSLPHSVVPAKVLNSSTLSPFLVRMADSNKIIRETEQSNVHPIPTEVKWEANSSFAAPPVVHTTAPVEILHPFPARKFAEAVDVPVVQSKPVVRVVANHRAVSDHPENPRISRIVNPLSDRLRADARLQERDVSSRIEEIHRWSSSRPECLHTSFRPGSLPMSSTNRQSNTVANALAAVSNEIQIVKEEIVSQINPPTVVNSRITRSDIAIAMHQKIVPHVATKIIAAAKKRISNGKLDETQKSISSYFNVVQHRKTAPVKDIEAKSSDDKKKKADAFEMKVITLSQMDTVEHDEEQPDIECLAVDIVIPNRNQLRPVASRIPSNVVSGDISSITDPFSITHDLTNEGISESNSHDALAEDMYVPEYLSPFQTPCSSEKADDAMAFTTTADLTKPIGDGMVSVNSTKDLLQRTRSHISQDQHDPVKKKRTTSYGDSGRVFDELCMTPANTRNAFDVTLPTQTNYLSPKAEVVSGRSIIDKLKALDILCLADVMKRKSFWMLPKVIHIQGVCKLTSELKAYSGTWKLNAMLSDSSLHNVPCEFSPQLLEKMLGFNVPSCKTLTIDRDNIEITRRKKRANLVLKSLHRLDLLLKVEFSPDAQIPIVFEVSTLSEALQIS